MVQLPNNQLSEAAKMELLYNWYSKKEELKAIQASERALRETVVNAFLPESEKKEGTNTIKLPTGDDLKIVCGIDRKVDKAIFSNILEALLEKGVDVNEVVETKVELRVANYKKLTEEQRNVMDECVTSKWGSPQVSVKVNS